MNVTNSQKDNWQEIDNNLHTYSETEQKQIQEAIVFMAKTLDSNCLNPKPVILHSIRVGIRLQMLKCPVNTVIAGYLHDILEDSNCSLELVKKKFSNEVAEKVMANTLDVTYDMSHEKYQSEWNDLIKRLISAGEDAMLIKIVDTLDNYFYYPKIKDPMVYAKYKWKMNKLMNSIEPYLKHHKIFQIFSKKIVAMK